VTVQNASRNDAVGEPGSGGEIPPRFIGAATKAPVSPSHHTAVVTVFSNRLEALPILTNSCNHGEVECS
jgi:hypothetical protein